MIETVPDAGLTSSNRSRPVDDTAQLGTDSPRKLGRSRTDTMVFSEAFNMAEELSKSEDGGRSAVDSLLSNSPVIEAQPLIPEQPWSDFETRTEDLDDEDIGDARSELTISGHLSPPVEALSLISLEDAPSAPEPSEAAPPLPSESLPQGPPSDGPSIQTNVEEAIPVADASVDHALAENPSTSEVVESLSEEANAAVSEASTETIHVLPAPTESIVKATSEHVDPTPSSSKEETKAIEVHAECELPLPPSPPPEAVFELNEPPPSEPIPPESESDITDEVGELVGDEVRQGEEEEAVVGTKHLVG